MSSPNKAPLRKVIKTGKVEGINGLVDEIECGHLWVLSFGDPKTGWGGSSAAKRRRCSACLREMNATEVKK